MRLSLARDFGDAIPVGKGRATEHSRIRSVRLGPIIYEAFADAVKGRVPG